MAEEQTPQAGTTDAVVTTAATPQATTPTPQDSESVENLPGWAQKVIKDLRAESASHRKAKTAAEQAAQAAAEQAAKEQGRWRELAEQYEPKAKRASELEAFLAELLDSELAGVPEKLKPLVPEGDVLARLRWVRAAKEAGVLTPPAAPQTDAGQRSAGVPRGALSQERRQELGARYGVRADLLPENIGV